MTNSEPFVARSFVVPSPGGQQRIYTTMPRNRILLTTTATNTEFKKEKEVLMAVRLDTTPPIRIGTHLLALGIPVMGMVTGLFPLPSVDGKFRMFIQYHPLPKPNMGKSP